MNDRSRMMLYALTAVACVMWIWQSVKESMNDGTIISTSNIIFLVCIGIAAIYCAANALILWWRQPGKDDAADDDETDSTDAEAEALVGKDRESHQRDLYESIERGDFPRWTMYVQLMTEEEARNYKLNPFDLTKVWYHKDFPLHEVGVLELNRNPENYYADVEQAGEGSYRRVGVQGRVHLVTGHGGAEGHGGGVRITDLPHQDHVRVLAHHGPDAVGKVELGRLAHHGLAHQG